MTKKKVSKKEKIPKVLKVTKKNIKDLAKKSKDGETFGPADMDVILRLASQQMKEESEAIKDLSPIKYIADKLGIESSALNSYFFTSYGVFQKDIQEDKINPYVAYTVATIHALNLGFMLGRMKKGGKRGSDSTSKLKN